MLLYTIDLCTIGIGNRSLSIQYNGEPVWSGFATYQTPDVTVDLTTEESN